MPIHKIAQSAEPMKQAKLSFVSKRTASGTAAGKAKTKRKQPARASSSPTPAGAIVISESEDDELHVALVKKRRLTLKTPRDDEEKDVELVEEVREKEPLDVSDKRWRKVYGEARSKMGNIDPGECAYPAKVSQTDSTAVSPCKRADYGQPYSPSVRPVSLKLGLLYAPSF